LIFCGFAVLSALTVSEGVWMKKKVLSVEELARSLAGYPQVTIFSDMYPYDPGGCFVKAMQRLGEGLNGAEESAGGPRKVMRVLVVGDNLTLFIGQGNWTRVDFIRVLGGRESFSCMDGSADPGTLADQLRTGYRLEL